MEIFGIGPLELLFIILIALVVLGPKEMMGSAKKAAGWIKKLRQSEVWSATKEMMDLPNQVLKESGLDKEIKELQKESQKGIGNTSWNPETMYPTINTPKQEAPSNADSTEKEKEIPSEKTQSITEPPSENDK